MVISTLVFIAVLAVLIFVHELGHFLFAKLSGVGVLEFAIGFGPIIGSIKKGETKYSLRAIPLGGFVRMVGDDPRMREEESILTIHEPTAEESLVAKYAELDPDQVRLMQDKSKWFINKRYLPKLGVVLAGPGFNLIFAIILSISYFQFLGKPDIDAMEEPRIGDVIADNPAAKAGVKALDYINSINGVTLKTWTELADIVAASEGKELTLDISRPLSEKELNQTTKVVVKVTPTLSSSDELAVIEGRTVQPAYKIGIARYFPRIPTSGLGESIKLGATHVYGMSKLLTQVIWGMISGKVSTQNLGGPISIFKATTASAESGVESILRLVIFLNVSLAIFNLLPIPILDGGHVVFLTIESLKGSPINMKALERANQVGMFLLLLLMVFAFGNDIGRLFK